MLLPCRSRRPIVLVVLLAAVRRRRWRVPVPAAADFGGYPAIQFAERHYFHREFHRLVGVPAPLAAMGSACCEDGDRRTEDVARPGDCGRRVLTVAVSCHWFS